ncbi:hypothetical protein N9273_00405 [bacterium]|nr:hypothetical protein [bacterium]
MEANINNFLFKLDRANNLIEIFNGSEVERPHSFIRVSPEIDEKEFHFEISDWFIDNANMP